MSNIIPFEYDGHPIRFNDEGWINATDVAGKFGKEPNDWLQQYETLEYLCVLSRRLFSNSCPEQELAKIKGLAIRNASTRAKILRLAKSTGLVKTRAGIYGGSWLHPKLAVRFARWLSPSAGISHDMFPLHRAYRSESKIINAPYSHYQQHPL
ncbi:KilA-N domain-containing protein [Xenorhabdus bovienii]|uniref:KilA-N domain-containing protein n=1 Tax=Xenorhabdus bovienii TaxID=40576 RepID=UPI0023B20E76|nr:KilA-N domain-containing protein [Xenorhabdus bovienii]MDE9455860.1 KilA-N domain-containing protein [Xenorhabdus bovienii]